MDIAPTKNTAVNKYCLQSFLFYHKYLAPLNVTCSIISAKVADFFKTVSLLNYPLQGHRSLITKIAARITITS